MSSAGILNGIVLNGTIRYTFAACAIATAQAEATAQEPTRIALVSGQAEARAHGPDVTPQRYAYTTRTQTQATAVAPAVDGWKITNVPAESMAPYAESAAQAVRMPLIQGEMQGEAQTGGSANRTAYAGTGPKPADRTLNGLAIGGSWWVHPGHAGRASLALDYQILATRLVTPESTQAPAQAALSSFEYDVTRWMNPRRIRGRALSFNNAGDTTILEVFQKYASGAAISRARSRGLHSAILAKSIDEATAESGLSESAIYIDRDAVGQSIRAEALASGVFSQRHSARSVASAAANTLCSPDIYYGGGDDKTAFAWGISSAQATARPVTAVRQPLMFGVVQPAWASSSATPVAQFDATGITRAIARSSDTDSAMRITHLVWPELTTLVGSASISDLEPVRKRLAYSTAQATANSTGTPWHWDAVNASGPSHASAETSAPGATRYAKVTALSQADATVDDQAYKSAFMSGAAEVEGATASDAAVTLARRANGTATAFCEMPLFRPIKTTSPETVAPIEATSEASGDGRNATVSVTPEKTQPACEMRLAWADRRKTKGARVLRQVHASPDSANAYAAIGRNVFKINAGEPAPERRTLTVSGQSRRLEIPHASREYQV